MVLKKELLNIALEGSVSCGLLVPVPILSFVEIRSQKSLGTLPKARDVKDKFNFGIGTQNPQLTKVEAKVLASTGEAPLSLNEPRWSGTRVLKKQYSITLEQPNMKKNKNESGQILIFTAIILVIMLLTSLSLQAIIAPKIRLSTEIKNSVGAAFAAESGLEWCLFNNQISPSPTPWPSPIMSNGATYQVTPSNCAGNQLKSLGTFRGVSRQFEVNF